MATCYWETQAMFGFQKILRNEKNVKENGLLMFGFATKIQQNIKYNYN